MALGALARGIPPLTIDHDGTANLAMGRMAAVLKRLPHVAAVADGERDMVAVRGLGYAVRGHSGVG